MSQKLSTTELSKIISWYAEQVYYNMDGAVDEIEWLTDNLRPNALQQVIDFYKSRHPND